VHCTGVDEVIRFNGQLYIVQDIDLDDFDGDYEAMLFTANGVFVKITDEA
jgi:hypothetical protein